MILRIIIIGIFLSLLTSCYYSNECGQYANENYQLKQSSISDSIHLQIDSFLIRLNEPDIQDFEYETYRLVSSHSLSRITTSFLFQNKEINSIITYKEYERNYETNDILIIEEKSVILTESDWNHLQYLIYKFNFWTEEPFIVNEVADGGGFIIEGHRPQAKVCNKKTKKIIVRGSPKNTDKIGWLYDDLISIYIHTE